MTHRLFRAAMCFVFVLAGLAMHAPAKAVINSLDVDPGATLLFPYFEADTVDPNGRDTLLSFRNASATAVLGHVTVWTDLGVPVLTFNVYLTGYDIAAFGMRDILINGQLPLTASAGQDPQNQVSPKGPFSQDINFASCNGQLPYPNGVLFQSFRADLRSALTGGPATFANGMCTGARHNDAIARGYVTVDVVNNCTARTPGDVGYFQSGGFGDATNQNVLTGDYFIVDAAHQMLHQDKAVSINSALQYYQGTPDPELTTPGNYTFYGRRTAWNAADNREPLPTTWAVDAQAAGTEVIVWRDTKTNVQPFACNTTPAGIPLGKESAFSFDNQERPTAGGSSPSLLGLATQRVALGSAAFPLPAKPGWVYLGLNHTAPMGADNPTQDPAAAQAYVTVVQFPESKQRGSTGAQAFALDGAQTARHVHPDSP